MEEDNKRSAGFRPIPAGGESDEEIVGQGDSNDRDNYDDYMNFPVVNPWGLGQSKNARRKRNKRQRELNKMEVVVAKVNEGRVDTSSVHPKASSSARPEENEGSKKSWQERGKQTAAMCIGLGPVPKRNLDPACQPFYRKQREVNMGFRPDLATVNPELLHSVQQWTLPEGPRAEPLPASPAAEFDGTASAEFRGVPIYEIRTQDFMKMIDFVKTTSPYEIAVDMEYSQRSYEGHTGTIQVGTKNAVFIIDAVGDFQLIIEHLKPMLEDPGILKLMWGIRNDVQYLRKDFETNLAAVMDLQQLMMIHEAVGSHQIKLETACKLLLTDYKPPPDCTNSDWIRDKRPKAWVEYAGADVVTLFPIWDYLIKSMEPSQVASAVLKTKSLLLTTYSHRGQLTEEKALEAGRRLYKGKNTGNVSITFPVLFQWRDYVARIVDDKPELLIPNQLLYALSAEYENLSDEKMRQLGLHRIIITNYSKNLNKILTGKNSAEKQKVMDIMKNSLCFNCINVGHLCGSCPFPRNKLRVKMFEKLNPAYRKKQQKRRRANLKANKQREMAEVEDNLD